MSLHDKPGPGASATSADLAERYRPEAAVEPLVRGRTIVDHRRGLVRLSPHVYNTVEDNMRAVERLASPPGVS